MIMELNYNFKRFFFKVNNEKSRFKWNIVFVTLKYK